MGRWSFKWPLFSRYKPFRPEPEKAKPTLTVFARAFKNAFDKAVTCLNDVHAAAFIQSAVGGDLDKWGVKLKLPRDGDEDDETYRARLLARWQETATGLTIAAIKSAVNTKGATYAPTLEVADVQQYYKNGLDWPDDEDPWSAFGGLWGKLELFTGHLELDRIPTPEEALELRDEVYGVKPGPTRARLVTPGALLGATYPPYYTLRAETYDRRSEHTVAAILYDDFEEPGGVPGDYTDFGDGAWGPVDDAGDTVMQGLSGGSPDPSGNIHNVAHVDDFYARVLMKLLSSNDTYSAGLAVRVGASPTKNGDFYMVLIRRLAPDWQWGVVWRSGGGDTMVKNWTNISFDPTADYFPLEVWLERGKIAVKANGTVLGTGINDGGYASQGGIGPIIYGNDARFNDLYVW
ncbi:MAG: hypothetical protein V3W11_03405 [bacterium]